MDSQQTLSTWLFICVALISSVFMVHTCHEGHKCIYYLGGKLSNSTNNPGYHLKLPISRHYNIQTTWQTDKLENVICGSSRGGQAYLDIEVVNKLSNTDDCILRVVKEHTINYDWPLIFDYVPSEVAQFCKNYTLNDIVIREFDKLDEVLLGKLRSNVHSYGLEDCIEIKNVRINRPRLDEDMRQKFEAVEIEKKAKELALQQKETEQIRLEIQLQKEIMDKERKKQTTALDMEIQIATAKANAEKQSIHDKMNLDTKRSDADAELVKRQKQAEGHKALFENPDFIRLETMRSAFNNAKIVIGEIPKNSLFNFNSPPTSSTEPILFRHLNSTM